MSIETKYESKRWNWKKYLIFFLGSNLMTFLSIYSLDYGIAIFILLISLILYQKSAVVKYKLLLRGLSLFLFLHFFFFPLIYIVILKNDPKSFSFDKDIFNSEKDNSFEEITSKYNPIDMQKNVVSIKSVLNTNSPSLDSALSFLNSGNLVSAGQFIISKNCIPVKAHRPMYRVTFTICSTDGKFITQIIESEGCNFYDASRTIKNYLQEKEIYLNTKLVAYNNDKKRIYEVEDIWSYRQILSYSINIFSTSNMSPKSRIANITFFIHQFIVYFFILGLLVSVFLNFLTTKEKLD